MKSLLLKLLYVNLPLLSEVVESPVCWKILFVVSLNTEWDTTQR